MCQCVSVSAHVSAGAFMWGCWMLARQLTGGCVSMLAHHCLGALTHECVGMLVGTLGHWCIGALACVGIWVCGQGGP